MGIRARQNNALGSTFDDRDTWLDFRAAIVTLGCLFGAGYSSYLLYQNFQNVGARTGAPMAKLERAEAKVRLKPASSFVWSGIKAHEDLYRKDSIQTAPKGGATVRFNDGNVLEVGENSLIIIDSVENLSLGFLRGSAVLRTSAGDSKITLDKDGKTRIEALPIHLITPEALSHYFTEGSTAIPIDFAWELKPKEGQAPPDGVSVQYSQDRLFRTGVHQINVSAQGGKATASVAPGNYYWRVLAHGQLLGEATRFSVDTVSALKPLFPEATDRVPVFTQAGGASVQFRWVPEETYDDADESFKATHHIEIASDPSFKTVVHSQPIAASAGSSTIPDVEALAGGTSFYWHILSHYESSHSKLTVRSATEQFNIDKIDKVAIELGSPADNETIRLRKSGIHFNWESNVDGVNYRWQLREISPAGGSAENEIQSGTVSRAKTYSWNQARAGSYQWRVEAVYQDKAVGESPWKSFFASLSTPIALRAPEVGKEIHFWTAPPAFQFSWAADPDAKGYLVQVAQDDSFKDAATAKTSGIDLGSQQIQLKSGPQFWRVSAVDADGNVINSSAARRLDYGVFPPLRAPASAAPAAGTVINPLEMEQDPMITWSPVGDAQSYEVTISQGGKVVSENVVKKGTQLGMKGIQAGKYSYSIRAIDQLQRKGEALGQRDFEITYGQPLAAPEALSPEVQ